MAADYFLKIPGIDGESKADGHTNEIEVQSFSFGVSNSGRFDETGGGGGAGKSAFADLSFQSALGKAGPKLAKASATGEHLGSAVLSCRKAGGQQYDYLKITLTGALVSSYSIGGGGGDTPSESFSLNFAKVKYEYFEQGDKGAVKLASSMEFDLKKIKGK